MAFRSMGYFRSMENHLRGTATYATSTQPKLKPFAPTADHSGHRQEKHAKKMLKGDFVPVYVVLGMICVSVSLGLYTAKQQISYSPNVRVKKKTGETILEVVEPDKVAQDAEKFVNRSFFRKIAHIQESDNQRS